MSELWTVNSREWFIGLGTTVGAALLTAVLGVLQSGGLNFDWEAIATVGLISGITYILRKLGTNANGEFVPVAGAKKLFTKK